MYQLMSLIVLDLSHNVLEDVDAEILNMKKLEILRINNNKLKKLDCPECEVPSSLRELYASANSLTQFPEEMGGLVQLNKLDLSRNKLNEVPKGIHKLRKVTYLNFAYNKVNALPKKMDRLKSLQELDLSNNNIKDIPQVMKKCKNLSTLDVSGNAIKQFPQGFYKMRKLRVLRAEGNPLAQAVPQRFSASTQTAVVDETPQVRSREKPPRPADVSKINWILSGSRFF